MAAQPVTRLARLSLLALIFVGLFQIFRRSLAASLALGTGSKLALLALCLGGAFWMVWRMSDSAQWRLAQAACVTCVAVFALQPGMAGYVWNAVAGAVPVAASATPPAQAAKPGRRTVVVILDEWDAEVATREGLFDTPAMQELLAQSFWTTQAMPAGASTLTAVPSMLQGRRWGPVDSGGSGYLMSTQGIRFDANSSSLFNDLRDEGRRYAVVGFYHDYCALARSARHCHAEPVQFFPGWWSSLTRAVKRGQEFDYPYSDFLRQWSGTYSRLREHALREIDDEANDMVWLHLNIPHPPIAVEGGQAHSLMRDYKANLHLMQALVDSLRSHILATKQPTALILTSDHWLRERELWRGIYERQRGPGSADAGKSDDQRVPFIVWFSDASGLDGQQYARPFSTTSLRHIVPALLSGRASSPAELASMLSTEPTPDLTPFTADAARH